MKVPGETQAERFDIAPISTEAPVARGRSNGQKTVGRAIRG